eukprot:TRINITY_DN8272_c0_g2_i1.p1 TRINITY_DN8272_c0_g2~~TRINITY_DN8272_c0_g2_i1.p1  ORF type:complete len:312 (-),score=57.10 TRINITY_DN8272_c0_g2_i1:766-1701(-)
MVDTLDIVLKSVTVIYDLVKDNEEVHSQVGGLGDTVKLLEIAIRPLHGTDKGAISADFHSVLDRLNSTLGKAEAMLTKLTESKKGWMAYFRPGKQLEELKEIQDQLKQVTSILTLAVTASISKVVSASNDDAIARAETSTDRKRSASETTNKGGAKRTKSSASAQAASSADNAAQQQQVQGYELELFGSQELLKHPGAVALLKQTHHWLAGNSFTFGRALFTKMPPQLALRISRQHFTIACREVPDSPTPSDNKQIWLTDNSGNGTYVNAVAVGSGNSVRLKDGDEIAFVVADQGTGATELGFLVRLLSGP